MPNIETRFARGITPSSGAEVAGCEGRCYTHIHLFNLMMQMRLRQPIFPIQRDDVCAKSSHGKSRGLHWDHLAINIYMSISTVF